MKKPAITTFPFLLILNAFITYKFLSSGNVLDYIYVINEDCPLNYNKGIVDKKLDSVSADKGFISIWFNYKGEGCDRFNVESNNEINYYCNKIAYGHGSFRINNCLIPIDSIFNRKFDSINYKQPWWIYHCDLKLKNYGRILGYSTSYGDTIWFKFNTA